MARTRTLTSTLNRIRFVADECLKHQRPVLLRFTIAEHGNTARCYSLARGIQQAFNSMRAQDRHAVEREHWRKDPANVPGIITSKYDNISCRYAPTREGDGYEVVFEIVEAIDMQAQLLFADTEEKVLDEDEIRFQAIVAQMYKDVTSVPVGDLFWGAERVGDRGKAIVNEFIFPAAVLQHKEQWVQDVVIPAWRERYEATAAEDSSEPAPPAPK